LSEGLFALVLYSRYLLSDCMEDRIDWIDDKRPMASDGLKGLGWLAVGLNGAESWIEFEFER